MENKSVAGTEEDFRQGYQDAYNNRGYHPTTVRYVDGYERGLYIRNILDPVVHLTGHGYGNQECPGCKRS